MGNYYNQLSNDERSLIYRWYHCGNKSIREIARLLDRSHSTISREIKRHEMPSCGAGTKLSYFPRVAAHNAAMTKRERGRGMRLKNDQTRTYVIEKLKEGWSPEIIAGRLREQESTTYVCHESIYQFIYKESPELRIFLPRKHKKRRKKYPRRKYKSKLSNRTSITERSEAIDKRLETGHWESDSIVSAQQKPGCNVLVERHTRLALITPLPSKKAQDTTKSIINKLKHYPPEFIRSITYDNGSENAGHQDINNILSCQSYFCAPYHSWEKGSVEQVNGLIRRYLPKSTDMTVIPKNRFREIESALNNRPRKCLGYKTPIEAYEELYGPHPNLKVA